MPRPHKLRAKLRGQQRFSCFFFGRSSRDKIAQKNEHFAQQTNEKYFLYYVYAACAAQKPQQLQTWRQPQTDTVTDLILLINAMQLLCSCFCSSSSIFSSLSAASWRRCCCCCMQQQSEICNLQHNLCSTTEKWSYWKMTVKRRRGRPSSGHSACHLVAATHSIYVYIYRIPKHPKQNVWHLGTVFHSGFALLRAAWLFYQLLSSLFSPLFPLFLNSCR